MHKNWLAWSFFFSWFLPFLEFFYSFLLGKYILVTDDDLSVIFGYLVDFNILSGKCTFICYHCKYGIAVTRPAVEFKLTGNGCVL